MELKTVEASERGNCECRSYSPRLARTALRAWVLAFLILHCSLSSGDASAPRACQLGQHRPSMHHLQLT